MKLLIAVAMLVAAAPKATKPEAVTITAENIKYGPVPPVLPAGAQLAVLHGDPGKKPAFAVRLKMPDGYNIPPHWHTNAEELTVLSGTFLISMGDKFDAATAHSLTAGAYHFLPAKMHHAAAVKGETVLELHGMGPFDIHYLNPADDPSKTAGK
ncbi:MAG TPA: cupin domain-containing protein [Myxococcaceae bacterium]|nr:cupin domain-containing protein [Myxococcaceae bacterium]